MHFFGTTHCIHNAFHTHPKQELITGSVSVLYIYIAANSQIALFLDLHTNHTLPAIQKPSIVNCFSQGHRQSIMLIKVIAGREITNPRNSSLL